MKLAVLALSLVAMPQEWCGEPCAACWGEGVVRVFIPQAAPKWMNFGILHPRACRYCEGCGFHVHSFEDLKETEETP